MPDKAGFLASFGPSDVELTWLLAFFHPNRRLAQPRRPHPEETVPSEAIDVARDPEFSTEF